LLTAAKYRALVSGHARGPRAALARGALGLAAGPYALAMRLRNLAFDRGWKKSFSVGVPVISVGNLTLGGTGKTPMVEWIARWLRQRDVRVTLISRGYGAADGSRNDEALELEQKLPDVPHLLGADRVAAARVAVEELDCQAILLDDGFQHRRLRRDLDIVLLDALDPWGGGRVFPRGLLREPLAGLRRADIVCLSRADLVGPEERDTIRRRAGELAPHAAWVSAAHTPLGSAEGEEIALEALAGRRVAAFCGIGNPPAFRRTLEGLGYDVVAFREFPDHHAYDRADVDLLAAWARAHRAQALACTDKDLVKLGVPRLGTTPLWAVRVGLTVLEGREALEERLSSVASSVASRPTSEARTSSFA
jgi:tetraacyldisaccharide 4'-kinase